MTGRDARMLGVGWGAGCCFATCLCLLSIALETRAQKGRDRARIDQKPRHVQLAGMHPTGGCDRQASHR